MNEKVLVLLLLCSLTVSAAVIDVSDLETANAAKVVCGDTVRLMRGREFHGQLVTKPGVVYTCFGEGPKPVVSHSLACDGKAKWTRPLKGQWHMWRSVVTSAVEVTSVILDEDRGGRWTRCVRKASLDELKKDREFWWNPKDGAVYFQFWCNPSDKYGRIELVQAGDAIVAADGVKVEGLSVRGAGGAAIGGEARGVTVRNCDFLGVGAGIRLGEACRVERCRFNGVTGDVFMGKGLVCRDNVMWDVRRVAEDAAALDFAFNTCVTTNTPGVDAQKNLLLKPRHLSNAGWDFAAISRYDFRIVAQGEGRKTHAGARDMPGADVDQSLPYPAAIPADAKLEVRDAGGAKTYPVPELIRSREWSATVNGVACGVAFGNARFECWAEQGGPYGIVQFEMTPADIQTFPPFAAFPPLTVRPVSRAPSSESVMTCPLLLPSMTQLPGLASSPAIVTDLSTTRPISVYVAGASRTVQPDFAQARALAIDAKGSSAVPSPLSSSPPGVT